MNGGYPTKGYRSEARKYNRPEDIRQGFQMPLAPGPIAPWVPPAATLTIPQAAVSPPTVAAAEQTALEALAIRTLVTIPHPLPKAAVAAYSLYRLMEREVTIPDKGAWVPDDLSLPYDLQAAGWYQFECTDDGLWSPTGPTRFRFQTSNLGFACQIHYDPDWPNPLGVPWIQWPDAIPAGTTHIVERGPGSHPEVAFPDATRQDRWWVSTTPATGEPLDDAYWIGPTQTVTQRYAIALEADVLVPGWGEATQTGDLDEIVTTEDLHVWNNNRRPNIAVAVIGVPQTRSFTQRRPRDIPKNHTSRPVRVGEREKKFKANPLAASLLARTLNFATESVDFLTAVWAALPNEYRTGMKLVRATNLTTYEVLTLRGWEWHDKGNMPWDTIVWSGVKDKKYNPGGVRWKQGYYPTPQEMADDLWRHHDKIDWNQAVQNLIFNQIEDAVYAKMSPSITKGGQEWLRRTGRPVGFETGLAM